MTAITFPNSPSSGDTHTAGNGIVYTYDGEKWTSIGTNSAGTWTRSGTEVSLTNAGDDLNVDSGTLFVDASTDRVGVGTSSPTQKLDVAGQITISSGNGYLWGNGAVQIYSNSSYLRFRTASTDRLAIDSSGNVGIGTTSPAARLHVSSSGTGTSAGSNIVISARSEASGRDAAIQFADGTTSAYVGMLSGAIYFADAGSTERARIDSSGRLLVGTSSSTNPNTRAVFQGYGTSTNEYGIVTLKRGDDPSVDGTGLGFLGFGNKDADSVAGIFCARDAGTWTHDVSQPTRLVFSTTADGASSPTERMRIANAGTCAHFATNDTVLGANSSAASGNTVRLFSGSYSATAVFSGTESFRIWSSGDVNNQNNSYTGISDIKLKENIEDAPSQWLDIKALRVRKYNLKQGSKHKQIGLIAQELEKSSPGLVEDLPDLEGGSTTKSVKYSVLYMKAVKALQEAMERIETLEASNADLLARVTALEAN